MGFPCFRTLTLLPVMHWTLQFPVWRQMMPFLRTCLASWYAQKTPTKMMTIESCDLHITSCLCLLHLSPEKCGGFVAVLNLSVQRTSCFACVKGKLWVKLCSQFFRFYPPVCLKMAWFSTFSVEHVNLYLAISSMWQLYLVDVETDFSTPVSITL